MNISDHQLQELFKKLGVSNMVVVSTEGGKAGQQVLVNGQSATCLADVPRGQAIALLTDKGNWYLIGEQGGRGAGGQGSKRNIEYRRSKYKKVVKKVANIKILFSVKQINGDGKTEHKFYVGGDRPEPTYLFSLFDDANTLPFYNQIRAYIDNYGAGINDFTVSVWQETTIVYPDDTVDFANKAFTFKNGIITFLLDTEPSSQQYPVTYMGSNTLRYCPEPTNVLETSNNTPGSGVPGCSPSYFTTDYTEIQPIEFFNVNNIQKTLTQYYEYVESIDGGTGEPNNYCDTTDEERLTVVDYLNQSLTLQNNNLQAVNTNVVENYYSYSAIVDGAVPTIKTAETKSSNITSGSFSFITNSSLVDGSDNSASVNSGTAILNLNNVPIFYGKSAILKQDLNFQINFTGIYGSEGDLISFTEKDYVSNQDKILLSLNSSEIELFQATSLKIVKNIDSGFTINLLVAQTKTLAVTSLVNISELLNTSCLCGTYSDNSYTVANAVITNIVFVSEDSIGYKTYNVTFNISAGQIVPYASFVELDNKLTIISSNNSIQQLFLNSSKPENYFNLLDLSEFQQVISTEYPYSYYKLPSIYHSFTTDITYNYVNNLFIANPIYKLNSQNTGGMFLDNFHNTNLIKNKFYITDKNSNVKNADADVYTEEWTIGGDGKVNQTKLIKTKLYSLNNPDCTIHSAQYFI